ncbi:sialate O-acetylesterase [Cyclobacterium sp. 1_MG-2023]|uniref:sialate O-acetylesterase n=1 Tax=Cyclobacterium sp. 1_MG-2023 TaxID=3062681 RepID=UPI0034C6049E
MEHAVKGWERIPQSSIRDAEKVLEEAYVSNIRLFNVQVFPSPVPLEDLPEGKWERANANTLAGFSASAWFFAKRLYQELGIPIGIIHSSWGGTSIRTWTDPSSLRDFKDSLNLVPIPPDYEVEMWKEKVAASIDNHKLRRNAISYPNVEVRTRVLSGKAPDLSWEKVSMPDDNLKLDHVTWFQKEVSLDTSSLIGDLSLNLGFLNRQSHVYWNGRSLGYFQYPSPVKAMVPDSLVNDGKNTISIRLASPWGNGAIYNAKQSFSLTNGQGDLVLSLAGTWNVLEYAEEIPEALPSYFNLPGYLFNGMVAPVIPYGIKGFIWDQGGADAGRPVLYKAMFKRLISDWRDLWHNNELPFLFVQNTGTYANHHFKERTFSRSYLREAQEQALDLVKTGMVVSVDIGDPFDVHPKNKQDFGNRLALQALNKVYGKEVVADGPFFKSYEIKGRELVIQVKDPSQQLVLKINATESGFEVSDAMGKFHPVEASLEENKIHLQIPENVQAKSLRYAWGDYPVNSIFNQEGLPMAPFNVAILEY